MLDTLTAFGFNENFFKWIKLLQNEISSSFIVNNHISDTFPIKQGVRQGCSLSMPLYVICFEHFAHNIRNYDKSKGMYLGKWKTNSDHPFGISWIDNHKILGYRFGARFSEDDIWSKIFVKIDHTLKLWHSRKLS